MRIGHDVGAVDAEELNCVADHGTGTQDQVGRGGTRRAYHGGHVGGNGVTLDDGASSRNSDGVAQCTGHDELLIPASVHSGQGDHDCGCSGWDVDHLTRLGGQQRSCDGDRGDGRITESDRAGRGSGVPVEAVGRQEAGCSAYRDGKGTIGCKRVDRTGGLWVHCKRVSTVVYDDL